MLRSLVPAFAVVLGITLAVAAQAEVFRLPKDGTPAFVVDAPAGWTPVYDQFGNLQLLSPDQSTDVRFSIITSPNVDTTPISDVAANIFQAAGAPPYARSETAMIAHREGRAFVGSVTAGDSTLDMRVMLVKLDASHFACLSWIRPQSASKTQIAAMNALIAHARITDR